MEGSALRAKILEHTVVARPRLCPEIRLRLITPECVLWKATEEEAAAAGLIEPYWAFPWAGGQALARHVLDAPAAVSGMRVLDFGAGGAIEGIAAAMKGARVTVADIDPMAVSAALLNAELNGVSFEATTENLLEGRPSRESRSWDVVMAGDVFYGSEMAARVIDWLVELAGAGVSILFGDANRGFFDPSRFEKIACFTAPADNDADGSFMQPATVYAIRPR